MNERCKDCLEVGCYILIYLSIVVIVFVLPQVGWYYLTDPYEQTD